LAVRVESRSHPGRPACEDVGTKPDPRALETVGRPAQRRDVPERGLELRLESGCRRRGLQRRQRPASRREVRPLAPRLELRPPASPATRGRRPPHPAEGQPTTGPGQPCTDASASSDRHRPGHRHPSFAAACRHRSSLRGDAAPRPAGS